MPSFVRSVGVQHECCATYTSTGSADLTMTKQRWEAEATVDDFISLGRDLMGRSEHKMGAVASEECRFRELFGVGPAVALITWNMLCNLRFLQDGGTMLHFLWTLCFLKVYAKQAAMCVLYGAVDPKMAEKWVSQFIEQLLTWNRMW